ncbi:membrane protein insertion efficiency factor YidD [Actinobaculum sp. 352]|uniref:membrane protein insertion efficiency factor YidD n=1 Tax=Actinobaculum sp. 352 TaxID=2490946 RepID=UPI00321BB490
MTCALLAAIRWYQRTISAALPATCRYAPSCSQYAYGALRIHGVVKGTLLSVWRILRCNPWSKGGVDRVPARGKWPSAPLDHSELMALYAQEDHELMISSGQRGQGDEE